LANSQIWINVTLVTDDSDILIEPEKYPNHNCKLTLKNKAAWGKINEK
jgi:hypothetical protein